MPIFRSIPGFSVSLRACVVVACAAVYAPLALAQSHTAEETKIDVQRHRAMAAAHTAAAQCLEAGKPQAQCYQELQAACKNLGIGKACGMKHVH